MTAPRRRWSFGLRTLFVVVTVSSPLGTTIPGWCVGLGVSGDVVPGYGSGPSRGEIGNNARGVHRRQP